VTELFVSQAKPARGVGSKVKERLDFPLAMDIQPFNYILVELQIQLFPILNILVPHAGHVPWVAGLPFFIMIDFGFFISLLAQYACIC